MENNLKKTIGFIPALATVMGTVIGAGVYFKAFAVAQATGTPSLHLLAWVVGGIITIAAGLTAAELAASIPETGGMLRYIDRSYGNLWSFLLGWAQIIIYFPANIAALAWIFGTQFTSLFNLDNQLIVWVALLSVFSITLINFLGSKIGGIFQAITLILKLVPLILIVVFGLIQPETHSIALLPIQAGADKSLFPALGAGLIATLFAYDGWIHTGNIAGEMKNPAKDLPRAIGLGLFAIMLIYLLVNWTYLKTLPFDQIVGAKDAVSVVDAAANKIFGGFGGRLVSIGVLISVYGAINGYMMTGMRLPYSMGLQKQLPMSNWLTKISTKTSTPINAGWFQLAVTAIFLIIAKLQTNAFDALTNLAVFVIWIFFTMVFVAVFIMRKKEPDLLRPYKVPLFPIIPIVAIIGGLFIVIMTFVNQPGLAMAGVVATLLGIPVYLWSKKQN